MAASEGDVEFVKLLVEARADLNFSSPETGETTPLITAAANDHKSVVSYLAKVSIFLQICG